MSGTPVVVRVRLAMCAVAAVVVACVMAPAAALAAEPGPYIFSTVPAASSQATVETVRIGTNPNGRRLAFSIVVDDPDGISSATASRSLTINAPGQAPFTMTPTFAYVAGTSERRAVLTANRQALNLPEGVYSATVTIKDKTGATTVYTWSFTAYLTTPHVNTHTPPRNGLAASPSAMISANVAGPRSAIVSAVMRVDGAIVPAVLTKTSNTVNSLTWLPLVPLVDGAHTVRIDATNAAGLSNTYTWTFYSASTQPAFTLAAPDAAAPLEPDAGGMVDVAIVAQDADGMNPQSIALSVQPPSGPAVALAPTTAVRVASGFVTVDLTARMPVLAGGGTYTLTASGTDMNGTPGSRSWALEMPVLEPVIDNFEPAAPAPATHVRVAARVIDYASGIDISTIALAVDDSPVSHVLQPVDGGFVVYAMVDLADNETYTASITAANAAGYSTQASWDFDVRAVPAASARVPVPASTYGAEDVTVRVRFTEPADGIDPSTLEVYFDGVRVPAADLTATLSSGGTVLDVTAVVRNVGGGGPVGHTAEVRVADTRGHLGQTSWTFDVVPQAGQAEMLLGDDETCMNPACHGIDLTSGAEWDSLHWVVGQKAAWNLPHNGDQHRYNCAICHFRVEGTGGGFVPSPMDVEGMQTCDACHGVSFAGSHAVPSEVRPFRFLDHDDASRYEVNAPAEGATCVYCHQGTRDVQAVGWYTNGARATAHDLVAGHRVSAPDASCSACHSSVLTREHAYDRNADGDVIGCAACHASDRAEVLEATRRYPALRFRFWDTDQSAYNTYPVPEAPSWRGPYSVETTGHYEIEGERIVGGRVRLTSSTLGVLTVEGYAGGSWSPVYSKLLGGPSDLSAGGRFTPKAFPVYPSSTEEFACAPVERVRIVYTPITSGWHYVNANVDSWLLEGAEETTCTSCHDELEPDHGFGAAMHTASVGEVADPSGFLCADCHQMQVLTEHARTSSTSAANSPVCATCHPTPRDTFTAWGKTCEQGGCHAPASPQEIHAAESLVHWATAASESCLGAECHNEGDLVALHLTAELDGRESCLVCHSPDTFPATAECAGCHADKLDDQGEVVPHATADPLVHSATGIEGQSVSGSWPSPDGNNTYNPSYVYDVACLDCHELVLNTEHDKATSSSADKGCRTCHPAPRNTLDPWGKTCTQGGCHTLESAAPMHEHVSARHATGAEHVTAGCGYRSTNGRYACHYHDVIQEHNRNIITTAGMVYRRVSCVACHTSDAFAGLGDGWSGSCTECHPGNHSVVGGERYTQVHTLHNNPGGAYDNGLGQAGSNAMDAHGPNRPLTFSTSSGCAATTCHTNAFTQGGYPDPKMMCSACHGPNVLPVAPYAGSWMWDGGQADSLNSILRLTSITLPAGAYLDFWTYFDIEYGYDWGVVQVSTNGGSTWATIPGTVSNYPAGAGGPGPNAITGSSQAWVPARFDLAAWAGQTVSIRFQYRTDWYPNSYGRGWLLDEIQVAGDSGTVFYDGAETLLPNWTVSGWTRKQ